MGNLSTIFKRALTPQFSSGAGRAAYVGLLIASYVYFVNINQEFLHNTWFSMGSANIWTHHWLSEAPLALDAVVKILGPLQLFVLPLLFFFSSRKSLRAVIFLLLFFSTATEFNRTQTHAVHFLIWSFVPFIFCEFSNEGLNRALMYSQLQLLLVYFLSGFWKAAGIFLNLGNPGVASLWEFMDYSIAQEYLNSNKLGPLAEFLLGHSFLSGILGTFAVVVQSLSLVAFLAPKTRWLFGLLALAFHLLTWLIFRIYFQWAFLIVFTILIWPNVFEALVQKGKLKKVGQRVAGGKVTTLIEGSKVR